MLSSTNAGNKILTEKQNSHLLGRVDFWESVSWNFDFITLSFFAFLFGKELFMNRSISSTTFMNCEALDNFLDLLIFADSLDEVSILDQVLVFRNTDVSCNFKDFRGEILEKGCHCNCWLHWESLTQSAFSHQSGNSADRENQAGSWRIGGFFSSFFGEFAGTFALRFLLLLFDGLGRSFFNHFWALFKMN